MLGFIPPFVMHPVAVSWSRSGLHLFVCTAQKGYEWDKEGPLSPTETGKNPAKPWFFIPTDEIPMRALTAFRHQSTKRTRNIPCALRTLRRRNEEEEDKICRPAFSMAPVIFIICMVFQWFFGSPGSHPPRLPYKINASRRKFWNGLFLPSALSPSSYVSLPTRAES